MQSSGMTNEPRVNRAHAIDLDLCRVCGFDSAREVRP